MKEKVIKKKNIFFLANLAKNYMENFHVTVTWQSNDAHLWWWNINVQNMYFTTAYVPISILHTALRYSVLNSDVWYAR